MKKGFTLLELIVVIIIIGVLATLGVTQYTRMIERARGAEAREILGAIRTHAAALYMSDGNCNSCTNAGLGVGGDMPNNCTQTTHYFQYNVGTTAATGFTATASRCTAGGKNPASAAAGNLTLQTNFATGNDTWTSSGQY